MMHEALSTLTEVLEPTHFKDWSRPSLTDYPSTYANGSMIFTQTGHQVFRIYIKCRKEAATGTIYSGDRAKGPDPGCVILFIVHPEGNQRVPIMKVKYENKEELKKAIQDCLDACSRPPQH